MFNDAFYLLKRNSSKNNDYDDVISVENSSRPYMSARQVMSNNLM